MTTNSDQIDLLVSLYRGAPGKRPISPDAARQLLGDFYSAGQVAMGTQRKGNEESHFGFALWDRLDEATAAECAAGDYSPERRGPVTADGGAPWIVDMVAPAAVADAFLTSICAALFPGETVHARLLDEDGAPKCIVAQRG